MPSLKNVGGQLKTSGWVPKRPWKGVSFHRSPSSSFTWLNETNPGLQERLGIMPSLMDVFFGELLAAVPEEQARRYRDRW